MFYRPALTFCAAIFLGMTLVTIAGWQSHLHRGEAESVFYPTGFGYEPAIALPEPLEFGVELAQFAEMPVYAASLEVRQLEKEDLRPLVSGIPGEPMVFERPGDPPQHFLMVEPDFFLRVHQGPNVEPFGKGIALSQDQSQ